MKRLGSAAALLGGLGIAAAVALPWIEVSGLPIELDMLPVAGTVLNETVSGLDTAAWPLVVAVGGGVVALAVRRITVPGGRLARVGLLALGGLTTVAALGLVYYAANLVDIELSDRSRAERAAAEAVLEAEVQTGVYVLLASGVAVVVGAAVASR